VQQQQQEQQRLLERQLKKQFMSFKVRNMFVQRTQHCLPGAAD
jgi:hypothetical protein